MTDRKRKRRVDVWDLMGRLTPDELIGGEAVRERIVELALERTSDAPLRVVHVHVVRDERAKRPSTRERSRG